MIIVLKVYNKRLLKKKLFLNIINNINKILILSNNVITVVLKHGDVVSVVVRGTRNVDSVLCFIYIVFLVAL